MTMHGLSCLSRHLHLARAKPSGQSVRMGNDGLWLLEWWEMSEPT